MDIEQAIDELYAADPEQFVAERTRLAKALREAAISEDGREVLARGRFVQPMSSQGFEVIGELAASAPPPARPDRRAAARAEQKRAKDALKEAKEQLRAAEHEAREAEREAERLTREAERARHRADEARAEVEAAASRVAEAEERVAETGRG